MSKITRNERGLMQNMVDVLSFAAYVGHFICSTQYLFHKHTRKICNIFAASNSNKNLCIINSKYESVMFEMVFCFIEVIFLYKYNDKKSRFCSQLYHYEIIRDYFVPFSNKTDLKLIYRIYSH